LKNPENGVYCFLIDGEVAIGEQILKSRDALGVWQTELLTIKSNSKCLYTAY
jgi:hypothetical protein